MCADGCDLMIAQRKGDLSASISQSEWESRRLGWGVRVDFSSGLWGSVRRYKCPGNPEALCDWNVGGHLTEQREMMSEK